MQDAEGLCVFTRDHKEPELRRPFHLTPDEREAWNVYRLARSLSRHDARGLPTLENLDLTLRELELHFKPGKRRALLQRVALIHETVSQYLLKTLNKKQEGESSGE